MRAATVSARILEDGHRTDLVLPLRAGRRLVDERGEQERDEGKVDHALTIAPRR